MTAAWNFCSVDVILCNKSHCSQVVTGTELTIATSQVCSMQCYLIANSEIIFGKTQNK